MGPGAVTSGLALVPLRAGPPGGAVSSWAPVLEQPCEEPCEPLSWAGCGAASGFARGKRSDLVSYNVKQTIPLRNSNFCEYFSKGIILGALWATGSASPWTLPGKAFRTSQRSDPVIPPREVLHPQGPPLPKESVPGEGHLPSRVLSFPGGPGQSSPQGPVPPAHPPPL